jgi:hypothetical protein
MKESIHPRLPLTGADAPLLRHGGFNSPALRVRFTRRYIRRSLRDRGGPVRRARRAHELSHE